MLYREIIAVCSQIHTKHINTLCGQNVELLNVDPGVLEGFIIVFLVQRVRIRLCLWGLSVFLSFWSCSPTRVMVSSFRVFLDHTQRRTTVGRTPLDE